MTPRTMAIAYRIWAYASAHEWNCTAAEIAEGIGESSKAVGSILWAKRWHARLRAPEGKIESDRFASISGKLAIGSGILTAETAETRRAIIPSIRRQIEAETWD